MKTLRNLLVIVTIGLMIVILIYLDFNNLNWADNRSDFIGLFTGLLLIISILLSNRHDRKQAERLFNKKSS